uniref:Reverse transcriptase domain-containing protein n=1 Tax=Tanacetum cinerariifolium TaxID=118510 RepID=A0A699IV81_TANCI|nr:hypothetical protein [Tanacetum cinerariifolium]
MSDLEDSTVTYTEVPPSPDYVPGPEEPKLEPPTPEFVPEPVYPKFMPPEDDEDPDEDDEDPEEDLADYPTDRADDDEEESSGDEADDEEEDEDEDEEEEEQHPAPADSILPPPVHHTIARISIPVHTPVPFLFKAEVERLLALPTPPPSPLSPLSSPLPQILSPLPQILSPPLPISPPPLPASPTYSLGYRDAMIRLRAESPSTSHPPPPITSPSGTPPLLPIPLPASSLPLRFPFMSHKANVPKVTLPPQKRLCIALGLRFEVGESSSAPTARPTGGLSQRMIDFVTTVRDRRAHARIARLIESKARLSHEAWVQSMDASNAARAEGMSLRTTMLAQQTEIARLRATDRLRQT